MASITTLQFIIGCCALIAGAQMINDIRRGHGILALFPAAALVFLLISLSQTTPA